MTVSRRTFALSNSHSCTCVRVSSHHRFRAHCVAPPRSRWHDRISNQPWFGRTWTFQELVLAQQVSIIFGNLLIEPSKLLDLIELRAQRGSLSLFEPRYEGKSGDVSRFYGSPKTSKQIATIGARNFLTAWQYREALCHGNVLDSLDVLQSNRHRQCKYQQDKVYAFLGLMSADERDQFPPDYTELGVDALYTSVSVNYVRNGKGIKLLHYGGNLGLALGQRSWAPYWGYQYIIEPFPFDSFKCATQADSVLKLNDHEGSLQVRGFVVDEVQLASGWVVPQGEYYTFKDQGPDESLIAYLIYETILPFVLAKYKYHEAVRSYYEGDGPSYYAMLRAMCNGDRKYESAVNRKELEEFVQFCSRNSADLVALHFHYDRNGTYSAVLEHFITVQAYRRIFVAKSGRIGSIPSDFQQGDQLVIIFGSPTPLLFRRDEHENEKYSLVGQCYVDGIMNGELFDENGDLLQPDQFEVQDFELY